ncbi:MAG: GtrA family protein [Alistipes sp.]|nr:GtrA family protein [Alistipes sp.]
MSLAQLVTRLIDGFYIRPVAAVVPLQTFRYACCGGLNMVLDALWYALIYNFVVAHRFVDLGVVVISPHILSMCLVFPITFFTGFWLNGHVAFRHSVLQQRVQLFRYALSIVGSLILTYVGLKFFVEVCGIWPTPSKVITTLITVVYSFLVAKYFTFRGCSND